MTKLTAETPRRGESEGRDKQMKTVWRKEEFQDVTRINTNERELKTATKNRACPGLNQKFVIIRANSRQTSFPQLGHDRTEAVVKFLRRL